MIMLGWLGSMLLILIINLEELPKVRRGYCRVYSKKLPLP